MLVVFIKIQSTINKLFIIKPEIFRTRVNIPATELYRYTWHYFKNGYFTNEEKLLYQCLRNFIEFNKTQ